MMSIRVSLKIILVLHPRLVYFRSLGYQGVAWDVRADGRGGSVVSGPWSVFLCICVSGLWSVVAVSCSLVAVADRNYVPLAAYCHEADSFP